MHILVVDDEELARRRLARLLDNIPDCHVVGEAKNGLEAIEQVHNLDPDLVFLDVRMPGQDGIRVAETLSQLDDPPSIIFCTAFDEYALQAFQTLAQGYILKPVELQQLVDVIEKTRRVTRTQKHHVSDMRAAENQRQHISATTSRGVRLVPLNDIACFVADNKYVTVFHDGGETLIDDTLKELEADFPDRFIRIHRNALVAIDRVLALEKQSGGQYCVVLKGNDQRPIVSRRHLSHFRETLKKI